MKHLIYQTEINVFLFDVNFKGLQMGRMDFLEWVQSYHMSHMI